MTRTVTLVLYLSVLLATATTLVVARSSSSPWGLSSSNNNAFKSLTSIHCRGNHGRKSSRPTLLSLHAATTTPRGGGGSVENDKTLVPPSTTREESSLLLAPQLGGSNHTTGVSRGGGAGATRRVRDVVVLATAAEPTAGAVKDDATASIQESFAVPAVAPTLSLPSVGMIEAAAIVSTDSKEKPLEKRPQVVSIIDSPTDFPSRNRMAAAGASKTTAKALDDGQQPEYHKRKGLWRLMPRSKKNSHKHIAKKLKNRNHTNIKRKVVHAAFGLFFAALNQFVPRETFVPAMAVLSGATLLMELLRYRREFGWMNEALHSVLGSSLRKHEMEGKFTGSFYFFLGVTVTAWQFPTTAATLGICQLALADPSASYFGRQTRHIYWSRIENGLFGIGRNKGVLGFLGGAAFCFPFNYRVLSLASTAAGHALPGGRWALVTASAALGLAGALADLAVPTPAVTLPKKVLGVPVPPFHLDDNFVVPIVSGWACTHVFRALGWTTSNAVASQGVQLAKFVLA